VSNRSSRQSPRAGRRRTPLRRSWPARSRRRNPPRYSRCTTHSGRRSAVDIVFTPEQQQRYATLPQNQ
jgi:hypothetical protein